MKKKFDRHMKLSEVISLFLFLILPVSIVGCAGISDSASQLHLVATYKLTFGEPSGVTYDEVQNVLWIVSGTTQRIYKTDTTGKILKTLNYKGDDLEGITLDSSKSSLWVVEEKKRELLQLDFDGNVLDSKAIPISGPLNSGLEGVAQDEKGTIYLLNEKKPGRFIELNPDLTIKNNLVIYFADDFSDMVYSPKEKLFFVLSDESKAMYKWRPDLGVVQKFSLPLNKFEGVTLNAAANKFFLVNNDTNELWIYSLTQ